MNKFEKAGLCLFLWGCVGLLLFTPGGDLQADNFSLALQLGKLYFGGIMFVMAGDDER